MREAAAPIIYEIGTEKTFRDSREFPVSKQ
jgi:hypothetical protein